MLYLLFTGILCICFCICVTSCYLLFLFLWDRIFFYIPTQVFSFTIFGFLFSLLGFTFLFVFFHVTNIIQTKQNSPVCIFTVSVTHLFRVNLFQFCLSTSNSESYKFFSLLARCLFYSHSILFYFIFCDIDLHFKRVLCTHNLN